MEKKKMSDKLFFEIFTILSVMAVYLVGFISGWCYRNFFGSKVNNPFNKRF
jgi:hypothetical protein